MGTTYDSVNAICPFYKSSVGKRITCEGITDDCITNIDFKSKNKKALHRSIFCDNKYKNCEVYRMLEAKYEE